MFTYINMYVNIIQRYLLLFISTLKTKNPPSVTFCVRVLFPPVRREGVTCLYVYFNTRVARIIRNLFRRDPRPD